VYRVKSSRCTLLAKIYFRHPGDPRDRQRAETAFLSFAWACGIRKVPRLLHVDRKAGVSLMEFVAGRKLSRREATGDRVAEAASFFTELNRHRESRGARALPKGSEACFSLDEHLECVRRRLARLLRVRVKGSLDEDAIRFIRGDLADAWRLVERDLRQTSVGARTAARLSVEDRCVSPSDFGFHNALLRPDGRLCFIDFEYAGWDDPAKTACDFFCQPAIPVASRDRAAFVGKIAAPFSQPEAQAERIRRLFPVYQLKWCCILLNEFLPMGAARRTFAAKSLDPEDRKADQLKKARAALARVGDDLLGV
jgi:hypothetical protein